MVVVEVVEGTELWPAARMGKVAEAVVVLVLVLVAAAVALVVVAGVKSEPPGATVPEDREMGKAKVCKAGAAGLAASGAAPAILVVPPNCRVGVAVEAGMVVGSWKLEENPVLVVAGAGAEKLKDEEAEEAGGARNPAPGAAVCCCCWFIGAAEKSPPPVVVAAVLEVAGVADMVPKLNVEVPEGCEVARAVLKLKPLVPPAVVVGRVGKLNPLPVVLGAEQYLNNNKALFAAAATSKAPAAVHAQVAGTIPGHDTALPTHPLANQPSDRHTRMARLALSPRNCPACSPRFRAPPSQLLHPADLKSHKMRNIWDCHM
ncbi:hypothetical protein E2C01_013829 [Portunus trituberculatus]|uniref:Uncharacterized protein n=1 Tax=Portunus trituberculatus TaxID=210409 RepID=A0A5B7DIC6_PORTR|nr:hypothetical protein [Portunus trituberculatus]